MKTSRLAARLLAANDKAVESLDRQLESVQKQAETVDPDDKARKLDLQSQKVELEKRKLKLQPPKEKEKAMAIKRVVARLQETSSPPSKTPRWDKFRDALADYYNAQGALGATELADKMARALAKGYADYKTEAAKAACKAVRIPFTKSDIRKYLNSD